MNEQGDLITIHGACFESKLFEDSDSGYTILSFSTDEPIAEAMQTVNKKYPTKCSNGFVADYYNIDSSLFSKRSQYVLQGTWKKTKRGYMFKSVVIEQNIENSKQGVIEYLLTIDHIGPKLAERIYSEFGENTLNIIQNDIDSLLRVKRFPKKYFEEIKASFAQNKDFGEVSRFFSNFFLPLRKIKLIFDAYKVDSIKIAKNDPFILTAVEGIGFREANEIALNLQSGLTSERRIQAGIWWAIQRKVRNRGHLYASADAILQYSLAVLNEGVVNAQYRVDRKAIQLIFDAMILGGQLVKQKFKDGASVIYTNRDYFAESEAAKRLVDFTQNPGCRIIPEKKLERDIAAAQTRLGIQLSDAQKKAVATSLNSRISVITGGPGTGKTTILKVILDVFKNNISDNISLCAPTGRAARRISESTGQMGASTIHHLLEIHEDYEWSDDELNTQLVDADLLVVDEFSMVDMELLFLLISSTSFQCKVIFLGDSDQLPSVGPGNVLKEIISSGTIPTTVLDKIYRQADTSKIVVNSHKLKHGYTDYEFDESFCLMPEADAVEEAIVGLFLQELRQPGASLDNIQILSPYKKQITACVPKLNEMIQQKINPKTEYTREIRANHTLFRVGDKVIQQKNSDDVMNGDIGYIQKIQQNDKGQVVAIIDFGDNRIKIYTKEELEDYLLGLAYAITVHKSQGSEYKTIIMPMLPEHDILNKNLIYTAWTRAKEKVIMVGNQDTLVEKSLINNIGNRNTFLGARMVNRFRQYQKRNNKTTKKTSGQLNLAI